MITVNIGLGLDIYKPVCVKDGVMIDITQLTWIADFY